MQDIQSKAITTYQNNLLFFQKKYPEIYKKISIISDAIENGSYSQNYSLEYKDNAFNILEKQTNQYLYNDISSTEHAKKVANEINFTKDKGVIETFYNYNFSEEVIKYTSQKDPTISKYILTAPIIHFSCNLIDKKTTLMKHIYKFIFLGVGLGVHITEVHKKINASMYMIIEDNLEIFRLSLFVTKYSEIGEKSEFYFSIMDNKDNLKKNFDFFYHNSFIRNNYLKYSLFYPHYKNKISDIQTFIITQSNITYPQDKLLRKNANVLSSIQEQYKFFNVQKHYEQTPFSNSPVILIAAGPSLNTEIEWLKTNAPHAIIIALFMTLPILERHGIKVDIIIHLDENMEIIDKNIERLKNKDILKDSFYFLAPSIKCSHFLQIAKKENIYLFEDRTRYRINKGFLESFSVGEIAYVLSLIFDTKSIYLLGLDLALDNKTKQTHAVGHNNVKEDNQQTKKKKIQNIQEQDSVSLSGTELFIKGNLRETVSTTPLFDISRRTLDTFTQIYKNSTQKVYNLNDGAYFVGTIPTHAKDIDLTETTLDLNYRLDIKKFFDLNSDNILDKEELELFDLRIKDAYQKKELIQIFSKQKSPTMEQFYKNFTYTTSELIKSPKDTIHELSQVYIMYLENIGGYIGDFFNTTNIPNPKRNIKQFQKIIVLQFLKIVDKYIDDLKNSNIKELS